MSPRREEEHEVLPEVLQDEVLSYINQNDQDNEDNSRNREYECKKAIWMIEDEGGRNTLTMLLCLLGPPVVLIGQGVTGNPKYDIHKCQHVKDNIGVSIAKTVGGVAAGLVGLCLLPLGAIVSGSMDGYNGVTKKSRLKQLQKQLQKQTQEIQEQEQKDTQWATFFVDLNRQPKKSKASLASEQARALSL